MCPHPRAPYNCAETAIHCTTANSTSFLVSVLRNQSAEMESKLDTAMQTLVAVFHKYSSKEGDKFKLNKAELKTLLQKELQLEKEDFTPETEKMLMKLDENKDGEVDFQEYAIMVAGMTVSRKKTSTSQNQQAKKATNLNTAIQTLVEVFNEYASKEGDKNSLNKSELKTLLQKELQLENANSPKKVEEMMSDLDANQDNKVDFHEFVILVATMTILCNEFFEEFLKSEQK